MANNAAHTFRRGWGYYFAYGSNLYKAQMTERCGSGYECVCTSALSGHRLAFVGRETARWGKGGVATVIAADKASVPGAIYAISPKAEQALDGFEGVSEGTYYKERGLMEYDGLPVLIYIASATLLPERAPSFMYLQTIRSGYLDWGLNPDPLWFRIPQGPAIDSAQP